jgi:hypothetical protein
VHHKGPIVRTHGSGEEKRGNEGRKKKKKMERETRREAREMFGGDQIRGTMGNK